MQALVLHLWDIGCGQAEPGGKKSSPSAEQNGREEEK